MSLRAKTGENMNKLKMFIEKLRNTVSWKWALIRHEYRLNCMNMEVENLFDHGMKWDDIEPTLREQDLDVFADGAELYEEYNNEKRFGYTW